MTYRINQKIGNHIYVYEVESYWDPEKKQPRQKRRYIGKKDPHSGEILTPRKGFTPRVARDFGHIYLLLHLARRIGLAPILESIFPDFFQELLYLSLYQVLEAKPLYLFKPWAEATYLEEPLDLPSQRISRVVEELGVREDLRSQFFHCWIENQGEIRAVIFDITSLSSYSKLLEYLEWGYNRDGENLPQVNLGLIVGQPSPVPIAYRIYPGSIADVSTLKNILLLLDELGVKEFTFILDRGFYSASNIKDLGEEGIRFILPLSFSTKLSSYLISKCLKELQSPLQGFYYKDRPMFHVKREVEIAGVALQAHLFHDEKRKALEIEHLMRQIVELEDWVRQREFWRKEEIEKDMEQILRGSKKLFEIVGQKPHFRLKRKGKAISRLMNRMGKMIILTNDPLLEREDLLSLYRRKDALEKMFDVIKNELEANRLRVSSREAMEGRIFLTYLSLILYSEINRVMKEKDLYKTYTLSELFYELKKLRAVTLTNGNTYLTEISKKQRNLFEKFDIPIPVAT
jgi:transposase